MKKWMVRQIGSGEDVKVEVEAETREEAIEQAPSFPWHVRKTTARPAKEGEKDDRVTLEWRCEGK